MILSQRNTKAMTKTELASAFLREPGAVEARQTAAGDPIPSELKSPKRTQVGVSVMAA